MIVETLPVSTTANRGLVEVMDEIRASQQARGYHGRSFAEMQAEEAARQEEDGDYERRYEESGGGTLRDIPSDRRRCDESRTNGNH